MLDHTLTMTQRQPLRMRLARMLNNWDMGTACIPGTQAWQSQSTSSRGDTPVQTSGL